MKMKDHNVDDRSVLDGTSAGGGRAKRLAPAEELGAFLRAKREAISPPNNVRGPSGRRTPGLRREEVAALASLSVDYVVRLEQARGLRPSVSALVGLSRALELTAVERDYLFDLARQRPNHDDLATATVSDGMAHLVEELSPVPAMLMDHRFDVLAWNDELSDLLVEPGTLPAEDRNGMWLCLAHPVVSKMYADRDRVLLDGVALLKSAWAAHPEDDSLERLIARIAAAVPEFDELWNSRLITVRGRGAKRISHPQRGSLFVEFEVLIPLQDPELRLLLFHSAELSRSA